MGGTTPKAILAHLRAGAARRFCPCHARAAARARLSRCCWPSPPRPRASSPCPSSSSRSSTGACSAPTASEPGVAPSPAPPRRSASYRCSLPGQPGHLQAARPCSSEASLLGLRTVPPLEHVHRLSVAEHAEHRRGTLEARVTSDIVDTLAQFAEWGAVAWIVDTGLILATLGVMLVYDVAADRGRLFGRPRAPAPPAALPPAAVSSSPTTRCPSASARRLGEIVGA